MAKSRHAGAPFQKDTNKALVSVRAAVGVRAAGVAPIGLEVALLSTTFICGIWSAGVRRASDLYASK